MISSSNPVRRPRRSLSTVLITVCTVGVLATIFFPTLVGPTRSDDATGEPDLDSAPAIQQTLPHRKASSNSAARTHTLAYRATIIHTHNPA